MEPSNERDYLEGLRREDAERGDERSVSTLNEQMGHLAMAQDRLDKELSLLRDRLERVLRPASDQADSTPNVAELRAARSPLTDQIAESAERLNRAAHRVDELIARLDT